MRRRTAFLIAGSLALAIAAPAPAGAEREGGQQRIVGGTATTEEFTNALIAAVGKPWLARTFL